jgi:hypothetical protein
VVSQAGSADGDGVVFELSHTPSDRGSAGTGAVASQAGSADGDGVFFEEVRGPAVLWPGAGGRGSAVDGEPESVGREPGQVFEPADAD